VHDEFEKWLYQMLKDAKEKLKVEDETIAYILLREGTAYYFKTLGQCEICKYKLKKGGK